MALRLHSEEHTAYLRNEQTEPRASAVWQGFMKSQGQCIFHCKHLSSAEKPSNNYQHSSMLFVFPAPTLDKTYKMLYWFRVIYASSSFELNKFPFFSDLSFDESLILIKFAGLIDISFLKTFSFLKAINIVSHGIV